MLDLQSPIKIEVTDHTEGGSSTTKAASDDDDEIDLVSSTDDIESAPLLLAVRTFVYSHTAAPPDDTKLNCSGGPRFRISQRWLAPHGTT